MKYVCVYVCYELHNCVVLFKHLDTKPVLVLVFTQKKCSE